MVELQVTIYKSIYAVKEIKETTKQIEKSIQDSA